MTPENLDRVVAWLVKIQEQEDGEEEEPYALPPLPEKPAADGICEDTEEIRYIRCLHYDPPVGGQQSREDSRCPTLIPVRDGGEASNFCSEHQGEALGEPATPAELDEIRADLKTIPAHAPFLGLLNTVLDAQSMRAGAGDGKTQQRTA